MNAVIFDLWDTLVPLPAQVRERAIAEMARALELPLATFADAWTATWVRRATGPLPPVVADIYRELTGRSAREEQIERALAARRAVHAPAFVPEIDAVGTLSALRADGVGLGLLTNCTSDTPELFNTSVLAPLFDAAAFSAWEGVMKPAPSFSRLLLARLGAEPAKSLFVGDGKDDELAGAARVGLVPVLYAARSDGASRSGTSVRSLRGVLDLLQIA